MKESGYTTGRALPEAARVRTADWSWRRVSYTFLGETFSVNAPALLLLALVVGLIGGTYGIDGGAIIAPFPAAISQLPIYPIAGAALVGTLVTSVVGVGMYYYLAPFYPGQAVSPNLLLGVRFGVEGFAGMYVGGPAAKIHPRLPAPPRPGADHHPPGPALPCGIFSLMR